VQKVKYLSRAVDQHDQYANKENKEENRKEQVRGCLAGS
jgi:hypothetical protein